MDKKAGNSQARQMVQNVYNFISAGPPASATLPARVEETARATGLSVRTVCRIINENVPGQKLESPKKTIDKPTVPSKVDECDEEIIRRTIYEFATIHKRTPTIESIFQTVRESGVTFTGQIRLFRRLLFRMGFRVKRTPDHRQILVEKPEVRAQRSIFLRAIKNYRAQGFNIVYNDETHIYSTHTVPGGKKHGQKAVSKCKGLIIVHAGGQLGFVEGALLIFKSGARSGNYFGDMNHDNYVKWLQELLIPNLPPRSVLVIDGASYHNVTLERNPTYNWKKTDMQHWLETREIPYEEDLTRPELYQLICTHKPKEKQFVIDDLLRQHGHCVLRLPSLHPELNPMEKIWAQVKNHVASNNVTFKLDDVRKLAEQKIQSIGLDEWQNACKQVIKTEDEYTQREAIIDDMEEVNDVESGDSDFSDFEEQKPNRANEASSYTHETIFIKTEPSVSVCYEDNLTSAQKDPLETVQVKLEPKTEPVDFVEVVVKDEFHMDDSAMTS